MSSCVAMCTIIKTGGHDLPDNILDPILDLKITFTVFAIHFIAIQIHPILDLKDNFDSLCQYSFVCLANVVVPGHKLKFNGDQ